MRDSATAVAGPLAVLRERDRAAVTIRTLGIFAVHRGDQVVPASAWQSRKARDLVRILAGRRGKAITRDALAELLWPDGGGEAAGNRLSVALSTARSVFDPDKAMPADHVIVADREAVRLSPSAAVDLEHYDSLADAAQTRDELRSRQQAVVRTLADALVATGRHGDARRSYRAYVDRMTEIDIEPAAFPQPARHRH